MSTLLCSVPFVLLCMCECLCVLVFVEAGAFKRHEHEASLHGAYKLLVEALITYCAAGMLAGRTDW